MPERYRHKIISNIVVLFSGSMAAQLATVATLFLTARALGRDGYGVYAACFALARILAIFFTLGLDTWLLREGNLGRFTTGQAVGGSLWIKAVLGIIWIVLLSLLMGTLKLSSYPVIMLTLTSVAIWFDALSVSFLTGFKAVLQNQKTSLITSLAAFALLALTAFIMKAGLSDPNLYASVKLLTAAGSCLAGLIFSRSVFHLEYSTHTLKQMFREFKPYLASDFFMMIYLSADVVIINLILGKTSTGIYSPATNIITALFIAPQVIQTVLVPVLTQQINQQDSRLFKTIRAMVLTFTLVGAGLWLVTGLLAFPMVWLLLGKEYLASSNILAILSTILFLKCGSFAMSTVLIAANLQKQRMIGQALTALTNVGLNLIIIQKFGITGVAWVYVVSEAVLLASYAILVEKWRKSRVSVKGPAARFA